MAAATTGKVMPAGSVSTASELDRLLSWFEMHGGRVTKLCLQDLGEEMSLSLLAEQALTKGDVVMSIPISLCMTTKTAAASELGAVLEANPELMDTPDEVLALHLMAERIKGEGSFWKHYLRTLPDDVDTPLQWLVEGAEEEFQLLDGTMVGLLSKMMHSQVVKDWEDIHLPLAEAHPEVLGRVTLEDYLWALSSIWSRSFDYVGPGPDGAGSIRHRAMVPVINAANHDPSAAASLSEVIEFQASEEGGTPVGTGERGPMSPVEGIGPRGRLRVIAGRDYAAREQFFILYGRYSNAKLLYSYGFVLADNPYGCLDYWVRVPPADPAFAWKQALLAGNPLTAKQAYDFSGTVRRGGWVSPALLATARVAQLTSDERPAAKNAFEGKIVSPRNEAASLRALIVGLRRKLASLGGAAGRGEGGGSVNTGLSPASGAGVAADEGAATVAALEAELERLVQQRQQQRNDQVEGEGEGKGVRRVGDDQEGDGADSNAAAAMKSIRRKVAALRVRGEERDVATEAIAALEASLRRLQLAASVGFAAIASFETLDSGN